MAKQHGGRRHGAGAKKGAKWARTLEKQAAHSLYRAEVLDRMSALVRAQVDAAAGAFATVAVAEHGKNGLQLRRVTSEAELEDLVRSGRGSRIALVEPDLQMSRYLTDQVVGKATESIELGAPGGGPIEFRWKEVHDHFAIPAPATPEKPSPRRP